MTNAEADKRFFDCAGIRRRFSLARLQLSVKRRPASSAKALAVELPELSATSSSCCSAFCSRSG